MSQSTSSFAPGNTFQAQPYTDSVFKTSHTLKFGYTEPKMDLYEDPDTNTVNAIIELPGLAKEDVYIHWNGDHITIGAEIPERDTSGHTICERTVGRFRRTLTTPRGIKVSLH